MPAKEEISKLKAELLEQKESLEKRIDHDEETAVRVSERDAVGELSGYDNHPADLGTELYEKERNMALDDHAGEELEKVSLALQAIEDGSYGTCKTCGTEIPYERLEAVPTALYCVEHTPEKSLDGKGMRPAEEDILIPSKGDHFEDRRGGNNINDKEDAFSEVARFGTSETPADFTHDTKDYDKLYEPDNENEGFPEDYEGFTGNDMDGKNRVAFPSEEKQKYEETLDEENIESQLGDIPYKEGDSYIDGNDADKDKKG